jgi:hypothetical protein
VAFSILSYFQGHRKEQQTVPNPRSSLTQPRPVYDRATSHTTTGTGAVLKRTEPTQPLIGNNPRKHYRNSVETDVAETWRKFREPTVS